MDNFLEDDQYLYRMEDKKLQIILYKLILGLKKNNWKTSSDWKESIKSDENISITKNIEFDAQLGSQIWKHDIDVYSIISFETSDNITYRVKVFISYMLRTRYTIPQNKSKVLGSLFIIYKKDFNNDSKIEKIYNKINNSIIDTVRYDYDDYISKNIDRVQRRLDNR